MLSHKGFNGDTTTIFSSIGGTIGSVTTAAAGLWSTSSTSSVSSILILFFLALVFLGVGSAEDDEVCGLISGSGTAKKNSWNQNIHIIWIF